jgi:signal transduction histidine kinase
VQDHATYASKDDAKSDRAPPLLARIETAWRSLRRFHSGIGWRLVGRVLLVSAAITLLLTLIQLYLDYRRDIGTIDLRMAEIDSGYRRSLGDGLWRLDARQLQLQAEGILHLPDIRYVEVREVTDHAAPFVVTAGTRQANAPMRREFKIFYTVRGAEQLLGILAVEATFDRIYRRLLDTAAVIMVSQGIQTFVVSFFILLIVHRLITRHLAAMAMLLKGHDFHRAWPSLRLERQPPRRADELDHLVGAFNDMCSSLRTAVDGLRESERQLAHANRVATMGQLSASIVHEVSQPIAAVVINSHVALLSQDAKPPNTDAVRRALEGIVRDGQRAAEILDRIRALIKKAPARKDAFDLNEAIREVVRLTHGEATKHRVLVRTQLADDLPPVEGDRVQLQQVVLNLIVNAIDAMSSTDEGLRELRIGTGKGEADGVLVAVRDSGPGLPPASLDRLFEPFYTTKSSGLGMGLSICRSIIEAHGGRLWAGPNVPKGAAFQFTVPINTSHLGREADRVDRSPSPA